MTTDQQTLDPDFSRRVIELGKRITRIRDESSASSHKAMLEELSTAHEELRVADEELRVQDEELTEVTHREQIGRWHHERLLALLPAPVVVTDARGLVTSVNAAGAEALSVGLTRAQGRPIASFVEPADRREVRDLVTRVSKSRPSVSRTAVTMRPPSTEQFGAELVAMSEYGETGSVDEVTWVLLTPGGPSAAAEQAERRESLARALVELTALPLHRVETREALNATARICKDGLGEDFVVSLSAGPPSEPELVASSGRLAQQVDGAQMTAGQGPSQHAWETCEAVVSPDIHTDSRWPELQRRLDSIPVKSAAAAPVRVGAQQAGGLTVYSRTQDISDPELLRSVDLLSTAVAAVLNEIGAKADLEALATQLKTALESRATIEQAKGMVMTTMGCGPDAAFDYISKISKDTNVKVRDVAAEMVTRAYSDEDPTGGNDAP